MFLRNSLFALFSPFSIVSAFVIVVPSFPFSTSHIGSLRETRRERQSKNFGAYFCLLFGGLRARMCFSFGCECSSVGRASPCQGECREFESLHSLHFLLGRGRFFFFSASGFFFRYFFAEAKFLFSALFLAGGMLSFFVQRGQKEPKKAPSKLRKARRQKRFFGGFCCFWV